MQASDFEATVFDVSVDTHSTEVCSVRAVFTVCVRCQGTVTKLLTRVGVLSKTGPFMNLVMNSSNLLLF